MQAFFIAVFAVSLFAQETPTERAAAGDVVVKMSELEKSIDVPTIVERLSASNIARDQVAARAKELMDKELIAMGDDITRHPEIGFQETRSIGNADGLSEGARLRSDHGRRRISRPRSSRGIKGNHGAPNLGVILEYDALRGTKGPFHGDQHSTQGPIGMAAAIAMAEYLEKHSRRPAA